MNSVVVPYIKTPDKGSELRYMLRSLANVKNFSGRVIILGDGEKWFDNIEHIPIKRQYGKIYLDQLLKMKAACLLPDIGDEFIATMDDVYIVVPTKVGVYYLSEELKATSNNYHQRTKEYTADKLKTMSLPVKDYESHAPMLVQTKKLLETIELILQDPKPFNLQWRSMYGNMWQPAAELFEDKKTKTSVLKDGKIISTNFFTNELHKLFSEKSIYEQ